MKKVLFFGAVLAGLTLASCGKKGAEATTEKDANAPTEQVENKATETEAEAKVEDRAWYTVAIPASWESKQYVSEMIVKKEGAELNFKEQAKGELAKWVENLTKSAEGKLDDITTGDITWNVFKNDKNFKTVYVAQVKDGVVRVGSSLEDPNDAEVIKILQSVKAK